MIPFHQVELPSPSGPRRVSADGTIRPTGREPGRGPAADGSIRFREPVDGDVVIRGFHAVMEAQHAANIFPATSDRVGDHLMARVPIRVMGFPTDPDAPAGPVMPADELPFQATGLPEYFSG